MFIAMNRFRIALGREETFEDLWRKRESYLDEVPGFRQFHLLRGPSDEEATLYASHTVWRRRSPERQPATAGATPRARSGNPVGPGLPSPRAPAARTLASPKDGMRARRRLIVSIDRHVRRPTRAHVHLPGGQLSGRR